MPAAPTSTTVTRRIRGGGWRGPCPFLSRSPNAGDRPRPGQPSHPSAPAVKQRGVVRRASPAAGRVLSPAPHPFRQSGGCLRAIGSHARRMPAASGESYAPVAQTPGGNRSADVTTAGNGNVVPSHPRRPVLPVRRRAQVRHPGPVTNVTMQADLPESGQWPSQVAPLRGHLNWRVCDSGSGCRRCL